MSDGSGVQSDVRILKSRLRDLERRIEELERARDGDSVVPYPCDPAGGDQPVHPGWTATTRMAPPIMVFESGTGDTTA